MICYVHEYTNMQTLDYCSYFFIYFADLSSQSPVQSDELLNERPPSPSPSVSVPQPQAEPLSHLDQHRSISDPLRLKDSSLAAALPDKCRANDSIPGKSSSLLNSVRQPPFTKESSVNVNGKTKPWESFIAEEFAQQFHESVLQSTQKALQKSKGNYQFKFSLRFCYFIAYILNH